MITSGNTAHGTLDRVEFARLSERNRDSLLGKVLLWGASDEGLDPWAQPALGVFVNLAGGRRARVLVLVQDWDHLHLKEPDALISALRAFGSRRVDVLEIPADRNRHPARGVSAAQATGILLVANDPETFLAGLVGSVLLAEIQSRYHCGAVIGGMGAGAAILGREMFTQHGIDFDMDEVQANGSPRVPGLSFLPKFVIDPSFGNTRNLEGLLRTLAANPALCGLGLEPGTAVLANSRGQVTSLGDGCAIVVDGRDVAATAEHQHQSARLAASPRLHVLREGQRFDVQVRSESPCLEGDRYELPLHAAWPRTGEAQAISTN